MNEIIIGVHTPATLLLDRALVLDEQQFPHNEFIEMQVVANRLVHIHHRDHGRQPFVRIFTCLSKISAQPFCYFAARFPSIE
jgi:hypothetical protein